jgi:hypothetical protein
MEANTVNQMPIPLPEFGPLQKLTDMQKLILSALHAGFSVSRCWDSSLPHYEQTWIGNGSRLADISSWSLKYRELIEEAGSELEPVPSCEWRSRRWTYYRLTRAGLHEVIRQRLLFHPELIICSLPSSVHNRPLGNPNFYICIGYFCKTVCVCICS